MRVVKEIKTVYVAGPYSKGDVEANVLAAFDCAHALMDAHLLPFVPHSCHHMHLRRNRDYEEWMAWDFAWLAKCDALLRMLGDSPGADREVEFAKAHGIPVFTDLSELLRVAKLSALDATIPCDECSGGCFDGCEQLNRWREWRDAEVKKRGLGS